MLDRPIEAKKEFVRVANPVRVQRKRIKGWRMPANTVYVGRPTKYGNPYSPRGNSRNIFAAVPPDNKTAVRWYREAAVKLPASSFADIRGKNLCCWCALDQPCHADVLLEIANK